MRVWIEDADMIEMNETALNMLYETNIVHDFLYEKNKLGISGVKGQGKTFLLKVKRALAEKNDSITCFPNDMMVDQLDNSIKPPKAIIKYFESYSNWVRLWKVAIALTIIKANIGGKLSFDMSRKDFPDGIVTLLEINNSNFRTSLYVNHILSMKSKKEVNSILSYTGKLLEKLNELHSAVYIFIDKIDQAFSNDIHPIHGDSKMATGPRNASFWQYCQCALAQTAYDINTNGNRHIKIYFSIRQEALIDDYNIYPNLKRNIDAHMVRIEYSKRDLKAIFDINVANEDDERLSSSEFKRTNPEKAFFGSETIKNMHINQAEDAFDYIYRHSLKRPSDIMKICNTLSLRGVGLDIITIREVVNGCAEDILRTYINEIKPFLPYDIERLFVHINTNIVNVEYMNYVCNRFANRQSGLFFCSKVCSNCATAQPFSVLYNIGLLGYIKYDLVNKRYIQAFKNIGSSIIAENVGQLPSSKFYFIHPCLMDALRMMRSKYGFEYLTDDNQIIGDDYEFDKSLNAKINEHISEALRLLKNEDIFVSSTITDLQEERKIIENELMHRGYNAVMSESAQFVIDGRITNQLHSHDYCIDRMLECRSVVAVIGKTYGGKYSGNKYADYMREIIDRSEGRITEPSISLMELYVAIRNNRTYYIFINEEFDRTKDQEGVWDPNIIKEYNFLNHLTQDGECRGNWISRYSLENEDFEKRLRSIVLS